MSPEREEAAIARLRSGDPRVYSELVSEYAPRLLRVAERLGHTPDQAEDLVQDAFLSLVKNADRFEGRASIYTWLYRVMLNKHADLVRRNILRRTRKPRTVEPHEPDVEAGEAVRRALADVPSPQQQILVLRFFEELPYAEIAEIVDLPIGSVHSHAFHGLRKLRTLLKEEK